MSTPLVNNSFESVLRLQRKGACLSEVSEKMQAAVLAVVAHNKPASVTLTFTITPFNAGAMSITDEVKSKLPVPQKGNSLFFATDEGALVRDDPNQQEMKLTAVPTQIENETRIEKSA